MLQRNEYPRPQFQRNERIPLNSEREFYYDDGDGGIKLGYNTGVRFCASTALYHRHIGERQARSFAHGRICAVLHGGGNYSLCAVSITTTPRSRA